MLQQGKFVADIVYYYGEDNNITSLFGRRPPVIPEGYNYDFINSDALINKLSVKDGRLITPNGMSYRVLVLDSNARKMSLPVLRKINALVKAGATVAGVKPTASPSLSDDQNEFNKLVNETWSSSNSNVTEGKSLGDVLNAMSVPPDFSYNKSQNATKLLFVHRMLPDREVYWVNNRNSTKETVNATFRVDGKLPVLWHPETAKTEPVSYSIANGITTVTLPLQPNDAVFVIFKDKAVKTSVTLPRVEEKQLLTIEGSWKTNFQEDRGAPAESTFDKLISYTDSPDQGIKYFSGTATYTKTIIADKNWFADHENCS